MKFEDLFDSMVLPVIAAELDSLAVIYSNPMCESTIREDCKSMDDLFVTMNDDDVQSLYARLKKDGYIRNHVLRGSKDGSMQYLIANGTTLAYEGKDVFYLMMEDVTKRQGIDDSSAQYRRLVDSMNRIFANMFAGGSVNESIQGMLATIGGLINASRVYVFEYVFSEMVARCTYEWDAENIAPMRDDFSVIPLQSYPRFFNTLAESGLLPLSDITSVPTRFCEELEQNGVKSFIAFSLRRGGEICGFLAFDYCEEFRTWTEYDVLLKQTFANLVGMMLVRREAENSARNNMNILMTVLDSLDILIYVSDMDTDEVLFANKQLREMIGEDPRGKTCHDMMSEEGDGRCENCLKDELLIDGRPGPPIRSERQNEMNHNWYIITDMAVRWTDSRYVHLQSAVEITDRKVTEEKLEYYAHTDVMTGTLNRERGMQMLQREVDVTRQDDSVLTISFVDVDGLKAVNDTLGHIEGDNLLVTIADVLKESVRGSDMVCRIGGDEFLIILPGCTQENAELVMVSVNKKLKAINDSGEKKFVCSISYGLKQVRGDSQQSVDEIIDEADRIMYEYKQEKRD